MYFVCTARISKRAFHSCSVGRQNRTPPPVPLFCGSALSIRAAAGPHACSQTKRRRLALRMPGQTCGWNLLLLLVWLAVVVHWRVGERRGGPARNQEPDYGPPRRAAI